MSAWYPAAMSAAAVVSPTAATFVVSGMTALYVESTSTVVARERTAESLIDAVVDAATAKA